MQEAARSALLVIDAQRAFDDPRFGRRNNPACEANIAALIAYWRAHGQPLVFVRHDSVQPDSPLAPGTPGHRFKRCVSGEPDLLVAKSVHSAFLGAPDLELWLRASEISEVAICGIQTNVCCETSARVASDLGFRTTFVLDATHTFDQQDPNGETVPAELLARVTASTLHGEFADVVRAADLVRA